MNPGRVHRRGTCAGGGIHLRITDIPTDVPNANDDKRGPSFFGKDRKGSAGTTRVGINTSSLVSDREREKEKEKNMPTRDRELSMVGREKRAATIRYALSNNTMVNRVPSGPDDLAGRILSTSCTFSPFDPFRRELSSP